jgi:hypothetical protein
MGFPDKFQPYRGANNLEPRTATQDQDSWSSQGPMLTYTNIIDAKTTVTGKISRGGYYWPGYTYGFNGDAAGLGPQVAQMVNGQLVMARIPTLTWVGVQNVGVHISDTTTGATDGAFSSNYSRPIRWQENVDFSRFAKIAEKTNEIKVGYMGWWDKDYTSYFGYPYYESYTYKSAATDVCPLNEICSNYFKTPYRVTVTDYPAKISLASASGNYRALYFNDKITWNRKLTLNVGVRMDWAKSRLPTQGNTGEGTYATKFVVSSPLDYYPNPDGSKAAFPTYSLWSPRLSFAYDITGNGRFAIKGSFGRYVGMTSSPGSQPGIGGASPLSGTSCSYAWDGTFPYKPNFGAQNYLGSPTNVGLISGCAKLQVSSTGQVSPISSYQWDPNLKPSYVNEFTATAEIGLSRDYNVRINVQRKFDRNNYKTLNLNIPASAYTQSKCVNDPGYDGIAGTADDNPNGPVCFTSVPTAYAGNLAAPSTYYAPNDETHHEGDNSYTAYVFTFNKNFSNRYQYVASYGVDMAHTNNFNPYTTVNGTVYGSNSTGVTQGPNAFFANMVTAQAPVTWSQSFKFNGVYGVPDIPTFIPHFKLSGVQYSATFVSQNGAWYSRSADVTDANGTKETIVMVNHLGRYPWLSDWDNQIRKKFKVGESHGSLEFTWDLFNTMNAATVQAWQSTDVSSSLYLQKSNPADGFVGGTPLQPKTILAPRIYQWGVTYKF